MLIIGGCPSIGHKEMESLKDYSTVWKEEKNQE